MKKKSKQQRKCLFTKVFKAFKQDQFEIIPLNIQDINGVLKLQHQPLEK